MRTTALLNSSSNGNIPLDTRINSLLDEAIIRFEGGNFNSFNRLSVRVRELLDFAGKWNMQRQWAKYLYFRGKYYFNTGDFAYAKERFESALSYATTCGDSETESKCQIWLKAIEDRK